MNAKKFSTTLLFMTLFFTMLAGRAKADVAGTFKMHELSGSYALTCEAQAALRHGNILPAHFPGQPPEFRNDSEELVVYSPYLTAEQRQTVERLIASVPAYALPIAWRGGAVYVFTRHSIVEAVPALTVEKDWFQDFGLYMQVERRLYVPFEKGEGLTWKRGHRGYTVYRWVPSKRDQFRVINHETGHMIDEMLGAYSLDSKGEDGQYRLSNRPDYLAATRSDLSRLTSPHSPLSLQKIRKLGYYMPPRFNGIRIGAQPTEQRARREVFAELWAEVHGYDKNQLSRAYPDTFEVVKIFADFLKAQDAAAPVQCKLN
jgi:hypothetical protein